jgi:hypothetical protein
VTYTIPEPGGRERMRSISSASRRAAAVGWVERKRLGRWKPVTMAHSGAIPKLAQMSATTAGVAVAVSARMRSTRRVRAVSASFR